MAKSYMDYLKEILQSEKEVKDDQITASNNLYQAEKNKIKKEYGQKIYEADSNYTDLVSKENVNKLINERKLKESIANKGLSNSGAKKTLDKNGNMSHKLKVDNLKNSNRYQVNELQNEMKNELDRVEADRSKAESKIDESFLKNAEKTAQSLYKANNKTTSSSKKKQEVSLKDEKEPAEERYEQFLFTANQYENIGKIIRLAIDRKTYMNERRLNKDLPDYNTYLDNLLKPFIANETIGKEEEEYIIRKLTGNL